MTPDPGFGPDPLPDWNPRDWPSVARVRALHKRQELSSGQAYCEHCTTSYPCATIKALDGTA